MRFEGQLIMWNPERGFGAIQPAQGGQEVFVHVSAFPKDGPPPAQDERLSFEIVSDGDGRKRAAQVARLKVSAQDKLVRALAPSSGAMTLRRRREEKRRRVGLAIAGLALAAVALVWLQLAPKLADQGLAAQVGVHR